MLQIPLDVIRAELSERVRTMRQRAASTIGKVQTKKGIVHNRPVIAGTRIQVESIPAFHEAGYDIPAIMKEYPTLTGRDVVAALKHGKAA